MFYLQHLIEIIVLPPGMFFFGLFLGLLLMRFKPNLGRALIGASVVVMYFLSTPVMAKKLLKLTSYPYHEPQEIIQTKAQAIVVLGGGRNGYAKEYGPLGSTSALETERLLYAAYLHQKFDLPLLLSSGDPWNLGSSEAIIMAKTLQNMGVKKIRWLEEKSATTYENAVFSNNILKAEGVTNALVVTHDWHMPRTMKAFDAQTGVSYYAAPVTMGFSTSDMGGGILDFLPQARAQAVSNIAMHELLGRVYYALKH